MKTTRRGIALPAAMAAIVALSSLAALSALAARLAIQEAAAVADDARVDQAVAVLNARLARIVATVPRQTLLSPQPIGMGDTVAVALQLLWPWHRVDVMVEGRTMTAQLAVVTAEPPPWCEAVVAPDIASVDATAVLSDAEFACGVAAAEIASDSIARATATLVEGLVPGAVADTIAAWAPAAPARVWRATEVLVVPGGATVDGVLVAPVVRVAAGARVRGAIIAGTTAIVEPGALVQGDRLIVARAIAASARLDLLGRRGLLHAR